MTSSPPFFPGSEKFDGTNWTSWSNIIKISARLRGARGYLDGTIPRPISDTTTPPSPPPDSDTAASTPWWSLTPSVDEWEVRDAWTMGLLIYNIKNPIGLGVKMDGSAAEAWSSLTSLYQLTNNTAVAVAQHNLRALAYHDGEDLPAHIANLRTRWMEANAAGANIPDADFRIILLTSLPESWYMLISTLGDSKSSADVVSRLTMHWSRISHGRGEVRRM